tara:strand:- start:498 stop:1079 length:582 start_codon:yes stop_codon:yes gene_type:complete
MNEYAKAFFSLVVYMVLLLWILPSISHPTYAAAPVANYHKVPTIADAPPQVATWSRPPILVICEYAPVSEIQINSAVKFWEGLGYEFAQVKYKKNSQSKCTSEEPLGHILVHIVTKGVKLESTALAQTHFFVDNLTNKIDWAVIYMRPDVRDTVLEHELGHSLGFLHFNKINHLMNQKWEMGGWDVEGLERND